MPIARKPAVRRAKRAERGRRRTPVSWTPPRAVAQLAEHRSPKPGVAGSSPAGPVLCEKSETRMASGPSLASPRGRMNSSLLTASKWRAGDATELTGPPATRSFARISSTSTNSLTKGQASHSPDRCRLSWLSGSAASRPNSSLRHSRRTRGRRRPGSRPSRPAAAAARASARFRAR
jgi:hypothetical protein